MNPSGEPWARRRFLGYALGGGAALSAGACRSAGTKADDEVAPAEDLMREHGLLNRILLVYEETIRTVTTGQEVRAGALSSAAEIVRRFVEEYHEKLEEDYLFPRFEKAGRQVELVRVLREQHAAGRRLTLEVLGIVRLELLRDSRRRQELADRLQQFVRMYRPHEAREDTVLFPAFHRLVSPREYDALGEAFEERERSLFGQEGFEGMVERVAEIEKSMGIYDLSQFTPT